MLMTGAFWRPGKTGVAQEDGACLKCRGDKQSRCIVVSTSYGRKEKSSGKTKDVIYIRCCKET